ncbi:MAG: aldehyde dehydrogenase family protein [Gammaproteobacteria bacterium]|nr:aldehyde dehydrogenase family protein [Gammaproteobacteria bacterium]
MSSSTPEVKAKIGALIERARTAQRQYERYDQQQVDEVVTAVGWAIVNDNNNHLLTEMAIKDTGIGKYEDKIRKNYRKTLGLLRDLKGAKSVGVIAEYPQKGLIEIARPVGVVGAVVPSTNPVATPFNKTINALKGRNAVILAPSPKGQDVCAKLVELIHEELNRVGAPTDLVQHLDLPVNKAETYELMRQVDLIVATGSGNNVRACYESGTPAVGVGAGNVPVIVDSSADLADAAAKICASKTFDNATSCSSENSLVILDEVYDDMIDALRQQDGWLLDSNEKQQLQNVLWDHGHLSRDVIAQTAGRIASIAGLTRGDGDEPSMLMVEETGIGDDYPFSDEKLSPVLTLYRVKDFEDAFATVERILSYKGKGHSVGIHTTDDDHVMRLGLEMPTCRVIVNQAHCFATGGSFDNGLPFSLSMGCGSWGGNSIPDNMNYRHYLNTTRIARTIPAVAPSRADIFGDYWSRHGIQDNSTS